METPNGTIIFTTVGRTHYGFDIFSLDIDSAVERRLTDGVSVNFNAQFAGDNNDVVFISERTGSARIYKTRPGNNKPELLPGAPDSLFHDRPVVTQNNKLYFISAHEQPDSHFKNWAALYSVDLNGPNKDVITRVTPLNTADFSPAVSKSGEYIAVASYGSRTWDGEFHEINTDITVFKPSEPDKRVVICQRGGWPTWLGDSTVYFHHKADDGWWSIYRVDLPENFENIAVEPIRVTPSGLHCFTPAAFHDGKRIAVATRRGGIKYRHIEIFDVEHKSFHPVTEPLNPTFHHYNPFVSADCEFLGYHRFRGVSSTQGESIVPNIELIASPIKTVRMIRINGSFPASSPDGNLIALNSDFDINGGIKIIKSDGSKRWSLIKDRTAFYNSWSPTERHVIYASLGPIFRPAEITVQIARIEFDPSDLTSVKEELPCEVKILTKENTGNNAFPSCSPDGKSIVFRSGRSGHKNLYILDAVNGEFTDDGIRQLTDGPWIDTMPCWSPKGDLIGFSSNRHDPDNNAAFGAYVVRPDGSGLRRIQIAGPEGSVEAARERVNHVSFNKDGDWIVFTANLCGITAEPVAIPNQFQPYGDLYVVKIDGTGLRRLTWNGYEDGTPTWYNKDELDLSQLSLNGQDGDKLDGQFDEPLWITCDL